MTQRRRSKKTEVKPRRFGRRAFLLGAGAACVGAGLWLRRKDLSAPDKTQEDQPPVQNPALPAGEWRAVWVSYLEWAAMDFPRLRPSGPGVPKCWTTARALG